MVVTHHHIQPYKPKLRACGSSPRISYVRLPINIQLRMSKQTKNMNSSKQAGTFYDQHAKFGVLSIKMHHAVFAVRNFHNYIVHSFQSFHKGFFKYFQ